MPVTYSSKLWILPSWKRALRNGIKTNVWYERILLSKLVGLNIIPRVHSLIPGRKVSQRRQYEGRGFDWKEKYPSKESRQPLAPRMHGSRCILELSEGTNAPEIALRILSSTTSWYVTVWWPGIGQTLHAPCQDAMDTWN